ncbi:MAG: multidrug ABC transporter ATP-binding protein, partial [Candidatus Omnitrophica bacterium CG12_big_fil_rev_8_21_14_0_65_50_5]
MIRNEIAIQTKDLTRKFGEYTAVNQINLSIRYGEIFGFLGANGAGKSTTIRLLCGILAPTGGTATVGGYDINTDSEKIKSSIGYVSQKFSLYTDLTVLENLEFYGHIYNISEKGWKNRLNEVLALSGLEPWKNHIAAELSGGWKQRLAIANATLHKPKILFLDEPTAGVDPVSRRSLW